MTGDDVFFLYDETENTESRFVSFVGETNRFDLCIITTDRFFGKKLVLNMQSNKFAVLGQDDLEEAGYLERAYNVSPEEAAELTQFLSDVLV